jgi:hypothetical protein
VRQQEKTIRGGVNCGRGEQAGMDERRDPDEDAIKQRAYEISQRANGGSPEENWRRAIEELRDEAWEARNKNESP